MYRVMLQDLGGSAWQYQDRLYQEYEQAAAARDNAKIDYPDVSSWIEVEQKAWAIAHA